MLEKIVRRIIDGQDISRKEAEFLIDVDLQQLKQAANQIREYFCGNDFDLCSIINGKSGRCSEDCKYCGQSIHYQTKIKVYDSNRNLKWERKVPEQITGFEDEVRACVLAVQEGRLECHEMSHAETLRMMELMDELRRRWGVKYPFE